MLEAIDQLDKTIFLYLNGFHNNFWDIVMEYITSIKFWIPFYLLIIIFLLKEYRISSIYILVAITLTITLCDQFASGLMKPLIERLRPCYNQELMSYVHVVEGCGGQYGFISSHAANTFGLATFLFLLLRSKYKLIWLMFLWAGLVSYSRIYVGVHYPLDILFGGLSGIIWAFLVFKGYILLQSSKILKA